MAVLLVAEHDNKSLKEATSKAMTAAAKIGGAPLVDRLLLRLHDVGQRSVARLVEAEVGGDDRRQFQPDGLVAAIDLAGHRGGLALDDQL